MPASSSVTLLDIAKLNGNDKVVGLIEENLKYAPELTMFPMRTVKGTSYKTGIRTGLPTTGFRAANGGQTPSKSTFRQAIIECFIFGGNVKADVAVADAYEDGAAAWQMIESSGVAKSALINLGKQIWYGTTSDSLGFPGIKAATVFGSTTAQGDAITINAGGTTASTASSVYAVKYGVQDCQLVGGLNGAFTLGDFYKQMVADESDSTKSYEAYVAALTSWIGLQVGNENAVRRIANVTADSTKTLTDTLLANLLATFPVGYMPDAIYMSRRSRTQLQISRTVVLNGGATGKVRGGDANIAPIPTEYEGIPIIATDSILNTDAIES